MENNQIDETELLFEIKEILDNAYSSDEDRNGNMYRYFDSYKAAEEIVFLLKIKFSNEDEINNLQKKMPKKTTCSCGSPIDYSNPDCVEFSLCKYCAMDA